MPKPQPLPVTRTQLKPAANIQDERRRKISMLMNYYIEDAEAKSLSPPTKRQRTEGNRSRDSEAETTLKPNAKRLDAYADIVSECTVKTLSRLIAQNYVDLDEGQKCHTPGCPRAPIPTIDGHRYCCSNCALRNGKHCEECNEIWGGVRAWTHIQNQDPTDRAQIIRQAERESSRSLHMKIIFEVSQFFKESSSEDDTVAKLKPDAPVKVEPESPEKKPDLFQLLVPVESTEYEPLYPPSSQDAEVADDKSYVVKSQPDRKRTEASAIAPEPEAGHMFIIPGCFSTP